MEKQKKPYLKYTIFIVLIVMLFTSCATVIPVEECITAEPFGFWRGLLHGFISPFSFIASLIYDDIAIYAINNNGAWYNFGFVLGAAILFGGSGNNARSR